METVNALVVSSHRGSDPAAALAAQVCIDDKCLVVKLPSSGGHFFNLWQFVVVSLNDLSVKENIIRFISAWPQK